MSGEADLIALLATAPEVIALGADKVYLNAADEGTATPYIVVTATHDFDKTLEGSTDTDHISYTIAAWGASAVQAEAVADAIVAVIEAEDSMLEVLGRVGGFDQDTSMDVAVLTADEWAT